MKKKIKVMCETCGQRFYIVGMLAASIVDDYNKVGFLMGIDPPWNDDKLITFF